MNSTFPYCEKFGFDENNIKRRLAFLYLGEADHQLAQQLHNEVIVPNANRIIESLYEVLTFHPESRRILSTDGLIDRLKKTQYDYLLSLGINFDSQSYFEERLRIGLVHAWIGLPLSVYLCAFRSITQLIIDAIPAAKDEHYGKDLREFLLKITTLDTTLALETYHSAQVSNLEDEVERMHKRADKLRYQASTDSLTGLVNHENSFLYLEKAVAAAQEGDKPLSILMADLDYFKNINDTHGHPVGDAVLQEVAARIQASVRGPDVVGRYGGEEFLVMLADADPLTTELIAERIRLRVGSTPINVNGTLINMTISIGATSMTAEDDFNLLIKRADQAMYDAKEAGRNCIIVH